MSRTRLTPGERVPADQYFATYVHEAMERNPSPNTIQHLRDYGHSILGSSQSADRIVDEWIDTRG